MIFHNFQPGDRVRLNASADDYRKCTVKDSEGTVEDYSNLFETYPDRVPVTWDNGSGDNHPRHTEIELVPAALTALTAEDIDALPIGAVIRDNDGDTYTRHGEGIWHRTAADGTFYPGGWSTSSIQQLPYAYGPVVLVSKPEPTPAPEIPTPVDLRARADELIAEADAKTALAAQYRAVADDLEQNK